MWAPAGQKQLEDFRTEMSNKVNDNYAVILKGKKLPLALLQDEDKVWLPLVTLPLVEPPVFPH